MRKGAQFLRSSPPLHREVKIVNITVHVIIMVGVHDVASRWKEITHITIVFPRRLLLDWVRQFLLVQMCPVIQVPRRLYLNWRFDGCLLRKIRPVCDAAARLQGAVAVEGVLAAWCQLLEDETVWVQLQVNLDHLPIFLPLLVNILELARGIKASLRRTLLTTLNVSIKWPRGQLSAVCSGLLLVLGAEMRWVKYGGVERRLRERHEGGLLMNFIKCICRRPGPLLAETTWQKCIDKSLLWICNHNLFQTKF